MSSILEKTGIILCYIGVILFFIIGLGFMFASLMKGFLIIFFGQVFSLLTGFLLFEISQRFKYRVK